MEKSSKFELADKEDPIDKILESNNKVMLIRMLSADEVLNYYHSGFNPNVDRPAFSSEVDNWRNCLNVVNDETINDNSKLKNNAHKIEQHKFVFRDIWRTPKNALHSDNYDENQFYLEALNIYNAVMEARQSYMSLICTCAKGKSRSTAVQLFNAIVRNNEGYFDKLSKNECGYIEPNIALLYQLLEHYVNEGNKLPVWLEGKSLNPLSLKVSVYKQNVR